MSSSVEGTVVRRKAHKGGKVMSLSILWGAVALVIVLVAYTMVSNTFHKVENQFDRDVVAVTSVQKGNKLQPVSPKIVASASESLISSEATIDVADYDDVWKKLERLAPETATEEERLHTIALFLSGLDYKMSAKGSEIVSITTGDPINPSTLTCYLNGYIPDKPYLKPNCPSF